MTTSVPEKFCYFVRASVYRSTGTDYVDMNSKIRVISLILESSPIQAWEDLNKSILPELKKRYEEENEIIDIESIVPVCLPQTSYMVLGSPGSGKTGGEYTALNAFETDK